jgi:hypothetical protein
MQITFKSLSTIGVLLLGFCGLVRAHASAAPSPSSTTPADFPATLFLDVRVFDGKSGTLSKPLNVLVKGNTIDKISSGPIGIGRAAGC